MKHSTRKLLFTLCRPLQKEPLYIPVEACREMLPQLSDAGARSLLNLLKKQQLIAVDSLLSESLVRLTDAGFHALRQELPVLAFSQSKWDGTWSALVFKEAPEYDKQFRYLRDFLLKKGALSLSRGVYVYPGEWPETVMSECRERYLTAVTIFTINEWILGDDRSLIIEKYALLDVAKAYSGISSEIDRLISKNKAYRDLNHQEKKHFLSLIDRLYYTAVDDYGLLPYYFPQVPTLWQLSSRLQRSFR
jgi:DNA-binding transcriptional regulator PaaX